jgi:hypothetical protein
MSNNLSKYITPEHWPETEREVLNEFLRGDDMDLQYAYERLYKELKTWLVRNEINFNIDEVFEEIIEANFSFFIEELVKKQLQGRKIKIKTNERKQ